MRLAAMILAKRESTVTVTQSAIAALLLGMSTALAADPTAGQRVFASRCSPCHTLQAGVNKVGPPLVGVIGRISGSETGFKYSAALKAAHVTWDEKSLDRFLENPRADIRGTNMFASLPSSDDRQNVIAYLETLKP
jgi:cytochrome c